MLLRRLVALAITVLVLAGIPYLLIAVVTWPSPDLSWVSVQAHLRGWRLPPGTLTIMAFGALWVVWALYLLAVCAETVNWLRRGRIRRRPLGPLQILAATALGTLTITGAATPALAETVATAPQHDDTIESSEHSESAEPQPEQDPDPVYEQRERHRSIDGFGYDSAEITDQMRTDLDPTIDLISQHGSPDTPIVVVGHTDAAGDPDYNQTLSERRAEAIADYLRDQLGEDAPPIETHGHGQDDLLADATDAEQRRAEITYTITTPTHADSDPDPASEVEPVSTDNTDEREGETERAVVLHLPSGAVAGVAAGAAAAAGAAGGYVLGTRRTTPAHPEGRSPTTAASPGHDPEPQKKSALREPATNPAPSLDTAAQVPSRVLTALTQAPGVGLQGPDAHSAARALLAAALTTGDTAPDVRLVICADDARNLLGEETADLLAEHATPNIALTESGPAALRLLHTTLVERQHQLDQADVDTLDELRTHDRASPIPPVVLLTHHDPDREADLAGLLLAAEGLDITAAILGRWPLGGTLTIDHGTVTDASSPLAPLHGTTWPATSVQRLQDLLNARPHRTPAAAPAPEPLPSTIVDHAHEGEHVPRPAAAPPKPPPDPSLDPPVEDTTSTAPEAPPPEPGEPPPPVENNPDGHAEQAAHDQDGAGGHHGDEPPPPPDADDEPQAAPATGSPPEEHAQRPIRVQLLSRIQVTVDGARVEMPRRAAYEVAAYLAVHHGDGVRLDRAIIDMWPDEDPRRTTRRFHDAIRTLRKTREPRDGEDLGEPVARDGEIYRFNPAAVSLDLWDLETALADAEHTDDLDHRHALVQRAVDLYAGDLVADADYNWIEPPRTRLRHRVTHALSRHAASVAADHPDVATAVLTRAVDIDPDADELHTALIRHLLTHGESGEARRAYTFYTEHMHRLGAIPDPKLRELLEKAPN